MESVILIPGSEEITTIDSKIILESYNKEILFYGKRARESLDIFSNVRGVLAGSNCFASIILRDLLPKGLRLATMADLGRATEKNPNFQQEMEGFSQG